MEKINYSKIYLIGMPACGKTTIGKYLAERLHYQFVDLDEMIVAQERKSIPLIFANHGENYFREIERLVLHQSFDFQKVVIATGGGTPCFFDNLEMLKKNGWAVYLQVSPESLTQRVLEQKGTRPLLQSTDYQTLLEQISEKLAHRKMFYEQAHLCLENEKISDEYLAQIYFNQVS